jgi:(S)-ureidoglycine aminohydrolase
VLARPMTGFAETFSQYAVELGPEGGSNDPEPDKDAQAVIFVASGQARFTLGQDMFELRPGSYVYLPPAAVWSIYNVDEAPCRFHWIRKRFQEVPGVRVPDALITHETEVPKIPMPDADGKWATQRFVDPLDLNYDFHVNIVNFEPGGRIPFAETHVMEHGLYVLQGEADYLLNRDWVHVEAGDFLWLRAFCPQACIAKGSEPFRYLLYKDVNRHMPL